MQNVGLGDVIFIILILGVVHGIMHLVSLSRKRNSSSKDDSEPS
jgi:hypothetical protein